MTVGAGERDDGPVRDAPFRARPTPELFRMLAERYELAPDGDVTDLGGGHLNLHISTPPGPDWVVRVYAPWVTAERVAFVQQLRDALRAAGIPVPSHRRTRDGQSLVEVNGRVAEVDQYVAGKRMDEHRQLMIGMAMLARVHNALDRLGHLRGPEPVYPNHITAGDARGSAERTRAVVASWPDATATEEQIGADMVQLAERLWPLEAELAATWHYQHVHGDFWDNNVLFGDAATITAVLDLDFSGWRPRTDDVALVLYYATATPGRTAIDSDHLHWLRACVDVYDAGLDTPLSADERASIPVAMARTVLFMSRNILALEDDASDYGAPARPAQRGMLAGMRDELKVFLDLVDKADDARRIFTE